jgi:alpha-L-rhamnosidase
MRAKSSLPVIGAIIASYFLFCGKVVAIVADHLQCEYKINPIALDVLQPRLSWMLSSTQRDETQTAYRILVASSNALLVADKGDLWDSGRRNSNQSIQVEYGGKKLISNQPCFWKVKVWDRDGKPSAWSSTSSWSMGLLRPEDWQAQWIGCDQPLANRPVSPFAQAHWIWFPESNPPAAKRWFRKEFDLPVDAKIKSAKLDFTADNEFALFINGKAAASGTDWRSPESTDITSLLMPGRNLLAVEATNTEPSPAGLLGSIRIELESGRTVSIVTDNSWICRSDEIPDWNQANVQPSGWISVTGLGPYGTAPWGIFETQEKFYPPATYLRKDFTLRRQPARAYLYVTSLGEVEPHLNGRKVGNDLFLPGWTDYHKRVYYRGYDVSREVKVGKNTLGAILGDGWFRGNVSILGQNIYGRKTRLLAQLELIYADGSAEIFASDASWKAGFGPILQTDHYDGETYDARREIPGWDEPGYNETSWLPVQTGAELSPTVRAAPGAPVRATGEIKVVSMEEPTPGLQVFDLGQNFAGWARLKVSAPRGTKITMRFGEMLNPDGTVFRANLRSARATDMYICKGGGSEIWEPRFTYHGFQYVEVEGLPGKASPNTLTGVVVGSNLPSVGSFACSNALINRTMSNMRWSIRSNLFDVPTDCPQRDERMGWMDYAEVAPSTLYEFDASTLFTKWVTDIMDAKAPDGSFAIISPDPHEFAWSPAWSDDGILMPWFMFRTYGDIRLAERNYDDLAGFLRFYQNHSPGDIAPDIGFGDWLALDETTPKNLISTAQFARCAQAMTELAGALGKTEDAAGYRKLWNEIRRAFQKRFINANDTIGSNSQGGYAMALGFDLLDPGQIPSATRNLIAAIAARGGHLSTGMVTTHLLLPALSKGGRADVAYQLLAETTYPSWGYFLDQGATTMWEHWDSKTDAGFNPSTMNSFNHANLGACSEWFYDTILGINCEEAGYGKIVIRPEPGGDLTWAEGHYDSIRGRIESSWKIAGNQFTLKVTIPANTTATIDVPGKCEKSEGAKFVAEEGGSSVFTVGSGPYQFQSELTK